MFHTYWATLVSGIYSTHSGCTKCFRMRFWIILLTVVTTTESACIVGNSSVHKRVEVEADSLCRFQIYFYRHECVSDPIITYENVKQTESISMDLLGHQCTYPYSTINCLCKGNNCNDVRQSREILAKQFARTESRDVQRLILCYLTNGDDSYENASKKRVQPPTTKRPQTTAQRKKRRPFKLRNSKVRSRRESLGSTTAAATTTTVQEPAAHQLPSGNSAKHHRHHHHKTVPAVPLFIVFGLLVLLIVCIVIVIVALLIIDTRKRIKAVDEVKNCQQKRSEDSVTPPEQFEQSVKQYSQSLRYSNLDPGLG